MRSPCSSDLLGKVELAVFEVALHVFYAEVAQRTSACLADVADDLVERVIGLVRNRVEQVAGAEQGIQPDGERMRAAGDAVPHECCLRAEHVRIDAVERVAPLVVIAVSAARREMRVAHAVVAEGVQYARSVLHRDGVDVGKNAGERRLGFVCDLQQFFSHFISPQMNSQYF